MEEVLVPHRPPVAEARPAADWRRSPFVNLALLAATVGTTTLLWGPAFSFALVGILLAHEMGHWLYARAYGVPATLPYFIPVPIGVGTLGAVIRMKGVIPSRRAALDIGAAGPLAGFAVAVPLLAWGILHSGTVEVAAGGGEAAPGSPWAIVWRLMHGLPAWPEAAGDATSFRIGANLLFWGAKRLLVEPLPEGQQLLLHPVAFAAWVGLLLTSLNLVPIGQLDGGHVLYALAGGRRARQVARVASWALLGAGLFLSYSWLVWWALSRYVVGLGHPPTAVEEPLGPGRRAVAWLSFAVLVLTFVPVPVSS